MTINRTTKIALSLSSLAIAISASVHAAPDVPGFNAAMQAQTYPLPKRYIVKFKNADAPALMSVDSAQVSDQLPTTMNYQPKVAEISAQHSVLNKAQAKEMKRIGRSNSYSVKLDNNGIKALRARADVEYVEEDMPRRLLSETTPWGQTFVGATQLSDSQAGNRTICIIDSGYDRGHSGQGGGQHRARTGTQRAGLSGVCPMLLSLKLLGFR